MASTHPCPLRYHGTVWPATRAPRGGVVAARGVDAYRVLGMFTTGAAYSGFREGRKGVVAPGAQPDLMVVDRDPTAIPPEDIRRVKVQASILAGEVAHGDLGVG